MSGNLTHVRQPPHNKCYGIEIECLVRDINCRGKGFGHYDGFFLISSDCSIVATYNQGVEFVSQPLPYRWLIKEIGKLGKRYEWTSNGSCGIHVHVTKNAVSQKKITALKNALYDLNADQMRLLFGRHSSSYANNRYLYDRYAAVNVQNSATIEFRMFRSGDAEWAKECVRRTKLMVEHKGKYDFESLKQLFGIS